MDELRQQISEKVNRLVDDVVQLTIKEGNRMVISRLREARDKARRDGGRWGKVPYGEHPGYPQEKIGLKKMIEMKKKGHPYRIIAESMEREDFTLRSGGGWNPGSVIRILRRHGAA